MKGTIWSPCLIVFDDRLARAPDINMFGQQTMFVDVWSPHIYGRRGLRSLTTQVQARN